MQGNVLPFFDVLKRGKTLQNIALHQRPDSVLLTLPQASSCDQNQSYNFQSTDRQRMEKSGFFRQHLITSIRKEKRNCRNVHPDLTYGSSAWVPHGLSLTSILWVAHCKFTGFSFIFHYISLLYLNRRFFFREITAFISRLSPFNDFFQHHFENPTLLLEAGQILERSQWIQIL